MTFAEITFELFQGLRGFAGMHGIQRFLDRHVIVLIVDELIVFILGMQRLPFFENTLRRQTRFTQA